MLRTLIPLLLLIATPTAAAQSPGLIVKSGETWDFTLSKGQPVRARKASPSAPPQEGHVRVTVQAVMGTTMTIVSNNPRPYTYTAELIGATKAIAARSCTLPADSRLSFENWPQKAAAVRLSNFQPAKRDGSCP